jgi:hypothetical protein
MNRNVILSRLQPYQKKQILLYNNQSTNDIIHVLLNAHKIYENEYDKICSYFWAGDQYRTAKNIFQFLKKNVPYKIEADTRQTVKSPAAILSMPGDCKHYSQFIGGIFDALCRKGIKINWAYRFANYRLFGSIPHHVFCVIKYNGGEIWIDPVLMSFNYKKPYTNKIDRTP